MHDVIVVGGGVTGAGVARDCAMRGLKTLLVEKGTPGGATTASSTHLIHGGLRYLLYDRLTTHTTCWDSGHIVRIARPLLTRLPILWPVYRGHTHGLETVETLLECYDGFQVMKGGRPHLRLSAAETLRLVPGLKSEGLKGAVAFDEWWVDPVGLVESNLESARRHGAAVDLGAAVTGLLRDGDKVRGIKTSRGESEARLVINAAGPWLDGVAKMAGLSIPMRLRKGSHLVYGKPLVPVGLLLEAEDRGRYVFVVPWSGGTLVGPTELDFSGDLDKIAAESEEVRYLLASARRYLPKLPERFDKTMCGARPILGQAGNEKLLSREYEVFDHSRRDGLSGFLSIGGGKMSDFRVMAEAVTDAACAQLGVAAECRTYRETLSGESVGQIPDFPRPWRPLKNFLRQHPRLRELHAMSYLGAGYARHIARRLSSGAREADGGVFAAHYR